MLAGLKRPPPLCATSLRHLRLTTTASPIQCYRPDRPHLVEAQAYGQTASHRLVRRPVRPFAGQYQSLRCYSEGAGRAGESRTREKTKRESITKVNQILLPSDANEWGRAYAGQILAWIDICAGMASWRFSNTVGVTASVDAVHFLRPITLGSVVEVTASVNRSWRSSMEVGVQVDSVAMTTGKRETCCHAYLTMVGIKDNRPCTVPTLLPETAAEIEEWEQAELRRKERVRDREAAVSAAAAASQAQQRQQQQQQQQQGIQNQPSVATLKAGRDSLVYDLSEYAIRQEELAAEGVVYRPEEPKPIAYSYSESLEGVLPPHANTIGITFGGQLMKWMQANSILAASRHCPSLPATASVDSLSFVTPTRVGDIVRCRSVVVSTTKHSVETYTVVEREDHLTGERHVTNDAYSTLVPIMRLEKPAASSNCVREDGVERHGASESFFYEDRFRKLRVPALIRETDQERIWEVGASERRRRRLELREQLLEQYS